MAHTYTLDNAPASLRSWVTSYLRRGDQTVSCKPAHFERVDVLSLGVTDDDTYIAVVSCPSGYSDVAGRKWAGYWIWECVHGSAGHQLWDAIPDIESLVDQPLRHRAKRRRLPRYADTAYRPFH